MGPQPCPPNNMYAMNNKYVTVLTYTLQLVCYNSHATTRAPGGVMTPWLMEPRVAIGDGETMTPRINTREHAAGTTRSRLYRL